MTAEEMNRAMTFEEKRQLSRDINKLPEAKLGRVIQIINERVPLKPGQTVEDEIEIDINSFDTPTLRTLQVYVRSALHKPQRRPRAKQKSGGGSMSHMQLAKNVEKQTTSRIQSVQKELQRLQGGDGGVGTTATTLASSSTATTATAIKKEDDNSSSESSSDSDSSSESESDSDEELNFHKSPVLASAPALSAMSQLLTKPVTAVKLTKDEDLASEPVKVQNKGAWSLLSSNNSDAAKSVVSSSTTLASSELWSKNQSQSKQKLMRVEEIKQHQEALKVARDRENAVANEKQQQVQQQQESEAAQLCRDKANEAELERERKRKAAREARENEGQSVDLDEQMLSMSSMEAEFGQSTSFLSSS